MSLSFSQFLLLIPTINLIVSITQVASFQLLHGGMPPSVELKVEMVAIHEKRLRKCLSKIKGIEKVEVEVSTQKVVVTGYVHRNKILKTLRRSGLKAEFWSAHNEILLNAYASGGYGSLRINHFRFF
ncbi:hypothetical protein Taro_039028 [Colocasia esculenta]|uniref:HMA domain-containing protein n=1 Tax=Colocasia esculenta TaxID=4460 RepID=A0A843WNY3_COLES|nr:hypothetical protein [Colocasia esculenta]